MKIKNVGKRFLSLALTLAVALTFSAVAPETSYAETNTVVIENTAIGTLDDGYTTQITDVPVLSGNPYEMYKITVEGVNSSSPKFEVPTNTTGKFVSDENSTTPLTDNGAKNLTSVVYKIATSETAAKVKEDLSKIKYTGAAKVKIVAIAQAPKANDYYYEGRYYRLSTSAVTWGAAMKDTDAEAAKATATYTGYKAHPVTITTKDENEMVKTQFYTKLYNGCSTDEQKKNVRIWLGAAPAKATGYDNATEPTKPNAECDNAEAGNGSSWKWMWNTPETGQTLPSDDTTSATRYWWESIQPSGGDYKKDQQGQDTQDKYDNTNVACMGIAGTSLWDDITGIEYTSHYIVEYSPYANNNWVYSDANNKVIADESNLIARGDFSYMTKSEMTFNSSNVWHPEQDFENNGIKGLKKNTVYQIVEADGSTKEFTSTSDGTYKLFQTTTNKATTYDWTGTTNREVTIKVKDATSSVKLTINARPAASSDDIVKSDVYSADTDKITLIQKEGIEYSINGGVNWTSTTKGGKVAFNRDKNNTTYTVTARKAATSIQYASKESTLNVVTDSSFSAGGAGAAAATESAKSVEDAKITAKTSVEKAATAEKYDKAEAAEVKAISTQAQKDITAAKTTADVEKIQAEAEAKIAAILTSQEKADTAAVKAINSKKLKLTSKLTKKNGKKAVKLTWNAPSSVDLDGYVIYRSVKKSTLGKKVYGTTTKTTYTNAKYLKKGNTYYYKIKGYKTINGEKVYTGWSTRAYRKIR